MPGSAKQKRPKEELANASKGVWVGAPGVEVEREPRVPGFAERFASYVRRKLGRDLQREIVSECRRAFQEGRHDLPERLDLPSPYGRELPERVVELLLARLLYEPGMKILDVGHANVMECHRAMLRSLPGPRDLTGVDIAEPVYDTSPFYSRSVRASVDATPFEDGAFDLIWCISSLEHIGMDNSGYLNGAPPATPEAALSEMARLLRPHGTLLITVPYGRREDHGWFRNFDEGSLQALLEPLRRRMRVRELYFAHTPERGWSAAEPGSLRDVGYGDQENAGAAALAAVLVTNGPYSTSSFRMA